MGANAKATLDGSQYRAELKRLKQESKTLSAEMKALKASFDSNTSASERNEKTAAQLNKQLATQEKIISTLKKQMDEIGKRSGTNSEQYMKAAENLHKAETAMGNMKTELDSLGEAERRHKPMSLELQQSYEIIGDAANKLVDSLRECVSSATEFEAAMANVSRTTGLQGSELENISASFLEMSKTMPVTATELAAIATTAGQLGIATSQTEEFTSVIARLATVAGMSSTEVATSMAQIGNITRDTDFASMADAIAVMGDATATTAQRILNMSLNLAAAASNAGMTSSEILAISAAVSSTGVEAQAGGTAISRLIQQINTATATGEKLKEFADVCQMSAAEFRVAWGEDSTGALAKFVEGLELAADSGQNLDVILSDLGISSQRELVVVKNLAGNSAQLTNALKMANEAYKQGTGLTQKYETVTGTTAAKVTMCQNAVEALKISIGSALTPAMSEAADTANGLISAFTDFATNNPELVKAVSAATAGIAALAAGAVGVAALTTALGVLGVSLTTLAPIAAIVGLLAADFVLAGDLIADINAENARMGKISEDTGKSLKDYADNVEYWEKELESARKEVEQLERDCDGSAVAMDMLNDAKYRYNTAERSLGNAKEQYYAQQEIEEAAAIDVKTQAVEDQSKAFQVAIASLEELKAAYDDVYEASLKTLESHFKTFDKAPKVVKQSTKQIMAALSSQEKYWNEYRSNLDTLKELADNGKLSDDLVKTLSTGTTDAINNAASIVEGYNKALKKGEGSADDFCEDISTAYDNMNTAMSEAAAAMADNQTDFTNTWNELVSVAAESAAKMDLSDDTYRDGLATVNGMINGISAATPALERKMDELAKKAIEAFEKGLGVNGSADSSTGYTTYTPKIPITNPTSIGNLSTTSTSSKNSGNTNTTSSLSDRGVRSAGNTVNIYAQELTDSNIDYIYNRLDSRMGGF